jgi:phosphoribosylglycinamide formyltransferase-1
MTIPRIAILASGTGSNAENIIRYANETGHYKVALVLSNKVDAPVLKRAGRLLTPTFTFTKEMFYETNAVVKAMKQLEVDFVVLAGFLWLVPENILNEWPDKVVNIHPALLPKYGGKGMYGMRVHEAVKAAGEKQTGITIHLVNEQFDEGDILFQETVAVDENDTPEDIAQKVHALEHAYFPKVIDLLLNGEA